MNSILQLFAVLLVLLLAPQLRPQSFDLREVPNSGCYPLQTERPYYMFREGGNPGWEVWWHSDIDPIPRVLFVTIDQPLHPFTGPPMYPGCPIWVYIPEAISIVLTPDVTDLRLFELGVVFDPHIYTFQEVWASTDPELPVVYSAPAITVDIH